MQWMEKAGRCTAATDTPTTPLEFYPKFGEIQGRGWRVCCSCASACLLKERREQTEQKAVAPESVQEAGLEDD